MILPQVGKGSPYGGPFLMLKTGEGKEDFDNFGK